MMRSEAAKDHDHAFRNWLARVKGPELGRGALLPCLDCRAGDFTFVRGVRENSPRQWSMTTSGSRHLDEYPLIGMKALDRLDSARRPHRPSPRGHPASES